MLKAGAHCTIRGDQFYSLKKDFLILFFNQFETKPYGERLNVSSNLLLGFLGSDNHSSGLFRCGFLVTGFLIARLLINGFLVTLSF